MNVGHVSRLRTLEQNHRAMWTSRQGRCLREEPSIRQRGREVSIGLPFDDDPAVDEIVADGEMHHLDVEVIGRSREIQDPQHFVPRNQLEADAVDVPLPSAPTRSTIRHRASRPTPAQRLILEGKAKGPRSGATINEPQHASALPRLGTTYDPRRTSNKVSVARTVGVLDWVYCG